MLAYIELENCNLFKSTKRPHAVWRCISADLFTDWVSSEHNSPRATPTARFGGMFIKVAGVGQAPGAVDRGRSYCVPHTVRVSYNQSSFGANSTRPLSSVHRCQAALFCAPDEHLVWNAEAGLKCWHNGELMLANYSYKAGPVFSYKLRYIVTCTRIWAQQSGYVNVRNYSLDAHGLKCWYIVVCFSTILDIIFSPSNFMLFEI